MYSPRVRALLRSGSHSNVPRPTMAPQRNRHIARSRHRATGGSRGPGNPAQSPYCRPPAGGGYPGPHSGPDHLRAGGLPPWTGHDLPDPVDQAPLAVHADHVLDLGHPHRRVIRAAWPDREPTWPAFLEGGAVLRITDAVPTTGSPGLCAAPSPTGATAGTTRRRRSPSPHTSGGAGEGPDGGYGRVGEGGWAPRPTPPPRYGTT